MTNQKTIKKKKVLHVTSDQYKKAIRSDIEGLKKNARKWSTNALIIGGTLLAAYSLVKIFFDSKDEESESPDRDHNLPANTNHESIVVRMIKEQLAAFLLNLAKKKLIEFLHDLNNKKGKKEIRK
ncbi:MAG: hypothetical protein FVQ77_09710 [Cytophagales bacterium]|nr:hypothetical protein [Cytophagales bacterium]